MSSKRGYAASLLAPLLAVSAAHAAEMEGILVQPEADGGYEGPVPRIGEVVLSDYTGSVTHHDRTSLGRSATVGDALDRSAGTDVRSFGAPGSYSSISLRGSDSDQVAVYLDGMLLNTAAGGGVDLGEIEIAQLAGVEVYRGTTPIQLGHALPGGAVNIRTPRPGEAPSLRLAVERGSFGERALSAQSTGRIGSWDLMGAGTYRRADNDFPYLDDRGTRFTPEDDREVHRRNADFRQASGLLKAGRELEDGARLDGLIRHLDKEQGLPSRDNANVDTRLATTTTQGRLRWRHSAFHGGRWAAMTGLHVRRRTETYDDRGDVIGLGKQHARYRTRTVGAEGYAERITPHHVSVLRLDVGHEAYTSRDLLADRRQTEATRERVEATLGNRARYQGERVLLAATLRHRRVQDKTKGGPDGLGADPVHDIDESWTTGELGLRLKSGSGWSLRANASDQVRTPSFYERFGDHGFVQGNPALKAERGRNLDLGGNWERQWARAWLPHLSLDVARFRRRVEDRIVRTFDARGVGQAENIALARISGTELQLEADLTRHWRFELHGTQQTTENQGEIKAFHGKQLPGEPARSLGTYTAWSDDTWTFYHQFKLEQERYYDSANLLRAEDRSIHDAGIDYRQENWQLKLQARNLTDDIHEDFNGYPKPGRSWHVELVYEASD